MLIKANPRKLYAKVSASIPKKTQTLPQPQQKKRKVTDVAPNPSSEYCPLMNLPVEILHVICSFLSSSDVFALMKTNRYIRCCTDLPRVKWASVVVTKQSPVRKFYEFIRRADVAPYVRSIALTAPGLWRSPEQDCQIFSECKSLKELCITMYDMRDFTSVMFALTNAPFLESVEVLKLVAHCCSNWCLPREPGIIVAGMANLSTLHIEGFDLTTHHYDAIAQLKQLKYLTIIAESFSRFGNFVETNAPTQLHGLHLKGVWGMPADQCLDVLSTLLLKLQKVNQLSINLKWNVQMHGATPAKVTNCLRALADLPADLTILEQELYHNIDNHVDDSVVAFWDSVATRYKHLQRLSLNNFPKLSGRTDFFVNLAQTCGETLHTLCLQNCDLRGVKLHGFSLPQLVSLDLSKSYGLSSKLFKDAGNKFPKLEELRLNGTRFNDASKFVVRELPKCVRLKAISFAEFEGDPVQFTPLVRQLGRKFVEFVLEPKTVGIDITLLNNIKVHCSNVELMRLGLATCIPTPVIGSVRQTCPKLIHFHVAFPSGRSLPKHVRQQLQAQGVTIQ